MSPKTAKKVVAKSAKADPNRRSSPSQAEKRITSFPIVAVGASAGGLEAFTKLLRALPPNPELALVFIPHLDPTHESAMVELLSRSASFSVLQAASGIRVSVNHLYVLPPNSDLTISGGVLQLIERKAARGQHMPIDTFFHSLAEDQTSNAVGVILSGTASDGTQGMAAIKSEGGITFAQDPQSAKYDSMPNSAISAGAVDFVLTPERIAQEMLRIAPRVAAVKADADLTRVAFAGNDSLMSEIFRLLKNVSKVDFADYKVATIRRRILRRMTINETQELEDYVRLLRRNRKEIEALYRDVLINVTSFFRNSEVFDSLREVVYPKLLERDRSDPIRVWVPGCSTGEETYSHAMSLVETLSDLRIEIPLQIFGTDLSEAAIQRARAGVYKESIASDVSEVRLRRFFHKVTGGYQISKSIRDMCVFARQNVFSDPPFSRMDLISCRNVLIYLSPVLQKRVVPIFHYALKAHGFLLVGNTEGLVAGGNEIFELIDRKNKIYQKKMVPSRVAFGMTIGAPENAGSFQDKPMPVVKEEEASKTPFDVQREADRLLLSKYVPSAVVVTEDLEIVQSRGHTNRFLELPPGKASLNLMKMARPGLLFELKTLIEKARNEGVSTGKEGIVLENGSHTVVKLEVIPFRAPARQQQHFLVLFEETPRARPAGAPEKSPVVRPSKEVREVADAKDQQIARLKQELEATKEYLQSIIEGQEATNEELQSANEEIQSGNEELQSTNEELQTSKEELESANEELNTVNEEMQHRNQQLAQLNNDLMNLLNSVTIPMVMLGDDLHIRRYTPEAEKMLGFSRHDLGKPVTRLQLSIDLPQLERWMLDVMREVRPRDEKVQSHDGTWYRLRITPYRTLENKIEGVVLVLIDISDLVARGAQGLSPELNEQA